MHYRQALLGVQASQMASKALQSEDLGEDEMQPAPKLLEVILQNCRGQVDQCLPLYIQARPLALGDPSVSQFALSQALMK